MNQFLVYKPEGATPLEALENLRREKGIHSSIPMTYAGRLDPMAEGLLLILAGEECKKKDDYLGLDKEYEIEVLLGLGSDTGDILGLVNDSRRPEADKQIAEISEEMIQEKLKSLIGRRSEKYPMFSSKTVNGKPLFAYKRAETSGGEKISDKEIPEKEIEIYTIDFLGLTNILENVLLENILERISKVKGDFRQKEIIESWRENLGNNSVQSSQVYIQRMFKVIKLHVRSSSGAYMRTLAEKLGQSLGVPALAWKIKRLKIGEYTL